MPERGRADVPRSPTSPPAMSTMSILSAIEISRSASGTDRRYVYYLLYEELMYYLPYVLVARY